MAEAWRHRGVQAALGSAVLFGAGTPLAKLLLGDVSPWLFAGLLYTGSGVGLALFRTVRRAESVVIGGVRERAALAGAVVAGGMVAPVLLMLGLSRMPATGASLLLNAEAVFTAVLAWVAFGENVDRRVVLGMAAIVAGAVVLTVPAGFALGSIWPALAVVAACACWGLDNNLTRKVALVDATWLAMVKGLVAGPANLALAIVLGARLPSLPVAAGAMAIGLVAYGLSLVAFIVGMRQVGTARAGAYFSVAPFFGAVLAVALGEPVTVPLVIAAALMALGVWLHLTERHAHPHTHEPVTHDHWHAHDEHHSHDHGAGEVVAAGGRHRHRHTHDALTHSHDHYPDAHHRHGHGG